MNNRDCPWLKLNLVKKQLQVAKGATSSTPLGKYTFEVILNDRFPYALAESVYRHEIEIVRTNKLPYFASPLGKDAKFKAEKEFVFELPVIIDEDGDDVNVIFDYQKYRWLKYDKRTNTMRVKQKTTTEADVGSYSIDIYLTDNYKYGEDKTLYFFELEIDLPERPYHIYKPKNKAPEFLDELTTEEQRFEIGKAWEFFLPEIFDFDKDPVKIDITSKVITPFIQAEVEPVPRIFISEGVTTQEQVGKFTVVFELVDVPIGEDTESKSTQYELKLFGIDSTVKENLARL